MAGYGKENPSNQKAINSCLDAHDIGFHGLTPTSPETTDPKIAFLADTINKIVTHHAFGQLDQTGPVVESTKQPPEL